MSTNYLETLKMMVSIGLGWSVLPKTLVDKTLRTLIIRDPVFNTQALSRNLGAVVHRERSLSNAATALLALLQASAED